MEEIAKKDYCHDNDAYCYDLYLNHIITKKYTGTRITEPISITCVITKSESERWKSFRTVVHVDLNLRQIFEGKDG